MVCDMFVLTRRPIVVLHKQKENSFSLLAIHKTALTGFFGREEDLGSDNFDDKGFIPCDCEKRLAAQLLAPV